MTQLREEVRFTRGRVIVRGKTVKRGEAKKADYILYYKPGIPIAVVEAKDNNYGVGDGMQQAQRGDIGGEKGKSRPRCPLSAERSARHSDRPRGGEEEQTKAPDPSRRRRDPWR